MPFKSLAQEGYLHAHPEILGKAKLAEFDAATKGKHLPERKSMAKTKVQKVSLGKKGSFKIRKGALHRSLGVPEGQKIGATRIKAALHSKNPETRKEARSARGLTAMHHGGR